MLGNSPVRSAHVPLLRIRSPHGRGGVCRSCPSQATFPSGPRGFPGKSRAALLGILPRHQDPDDRARAVSGGLSHVLALARCAQTLRPRPPRGSDRRSAGAVEGIAGGGVKLRLAEDVALPAEAITQTFGILGVRGSGKSNTAVVMAEEMFGAKLPFVVIDPVGSWWGLRSSRNGTGPGLAVAIFGGRHGDVPLERAGGALLADLVVDERLSCVLDVSEFSEGDKIRFLIDFAERLYRRNQDPLHLFLEEADDYCPQRPFREQARLLRAWENVVRRGRARGLGITMITQRSAALNKNVLTQIETLLVFRTTSPQDRKAIGGWVEYHGQSQELLESLPGLKDGEAWIWSPHWLGKLLRARIRLREPFDSAATPKDVKGRRPPTNLADVDLKAIEKQMGATIERAKQEDPRELRRRISGLESELKQRKIVPMKAVPAPKRVEIPVVKLAVVRRLEIGR